MLLQELLKLIEINVVINMEIILHVTIVKGKLCTMEKPFLCSADECPLVDYDSPWEYTTIVISSKCHFGIGFHTLST